MTPITHSHEQVLDGARGVWTDGELVAVWHGGRTLNTYVETADGWRTASAHQWMKQPSREQVAEQAQEVLD